MWYVIYISTNTYIFYFIIFILHLMLSNYLQ